MTKTLIWAGVLAAASFGMVAAASAAPIDVTTTSNSSALPTYDINPTPNSATSFPYFKQSTSGSISGQQLSPWSGTGSSFTAYSCLDCVPPPNSMPATATYTVPTGATGLSIFWGSPDAYNEITFSDGKAVDSEMLTGASLDVPTGVGHDWVTFNFNGADVTSITLTDTGPEAFEYADVTFLSATPLPATLPLFAGGLSMIGLLGWRRKRRSTGFLPA